MHKKFWSENLKRRDLGVDEMMYLTLKKQRMRVWNGFIRLRIGSNYGLL